MAVSWFGRAQTSAGSLSGSENNCRSTVLTPAGLIYRSFSSKEELYVLTVTNYLQELDEVLAAAIVAHDEPALQLEQWARAYAGFCGRYPAFLDCALSLMRRPARELKEAVSESVWLRLARLRVGLRQAAPGIPVLFTVSSERVVESCVTAALGTVGIVREPH